MLIFSFGWVKSRSTVFRRLLGCLAAAALVVPAACEDGVNDVGIEGFDREGASGTFVRDTLYVSALLNDTSFVDSITTSSARRLYLGSVDQYDFRIVMKFTMSSVVESVQVQQARIEMVPSASYGEGTTLTARIRTLRKNWTESDVLWTRFDPDGDGGPDVWDVPVARSDSGGTLWVWTVPRDTVQQWVYARKDTNRKNFGMIIDFQSGANFVQQFYSASVVNSSNVPDPDKAPRLVFSYTKLDGDVVTEDSIKIYPAITRTSTGSQVYDGGRSGYLYRDRAAQPADELWVGGGVVYHSFLYFNAETVPVTSTVTSAQLVMPLDPAGRYRYLPSDSVHLQAARLTSGPSTWQAGSVTIRSDDAFYLLNNATKRARLTGLIANDTLRVTITEQMQEWVSSPSSNYGLRLFGADELSGDFNRLYRVRFKRSNTDSLGSPQVILQYTRPPDN